MLDTPLVSGEIVFDKGGPPTVSDIISLIVSLEDTTYADAPAKLIAQQKTLISAETARHGSIPFVVYGEVPDRLAVYTISVLVDIDRDGKVGHGDYVNAASYPVLTFGNPNRVTIQVKEVT